MVIIISLSVRCLGFFRNSVTITSFCTQIGREYCIGPEIDVLLLEFIALNIRVGWVHLAHFLLAVIKVIHVP